VNKIVTIDSVARRAEVSISTVSRVINHRHNGDLEIRKRVLKAVKELKYKPNEAARTLGGGGRSSASTSTSYVVHSFIPLGTYFGDVLRGAEQEAQRCGGNLYFSTAYHHLAVVGVGSGPKGIAGECIRGMLCAGENPLDFYQDLKRTGIPVVYINAYPPGEAVNSIMCDNFAASYRVGKWLVELGHRRIACIGISDKTLSTEERVMGYRQALFDSGIPFKPALFGRAEGCTAPAGYKVMKRQLQVSPRPTAVFGVTDEIAVGAIQCAKAHGVRVPKDLSVVGVNDLDIAQMCDPPLTTIRIFREEMGRVAVGRLMDLIQQPEGRPKRIDVLCELVVRQSCAEVR